MQIQCCTILSRNDAAKISLSTGRDTTKQIEVIGLYVRDAISVISAGRSSSALIR